MLRLSTRRYMLDQFPTVPELRHLVNSLRRGNAQGASFKAALAEVQLVVALSDSREPEDRREALIRGEPLWVELQSPANDTPQMSKVALLTTLTDAMNICAASLRDIDAVALWKERSWKSSSSSSSRSATAPPGQSSSASQGNSTTSAHAAAAAGGTRGGASTEACDRDGDSVVSRLFGAVARMFGATSSSPASNAAASSSDASATGDSKTLDEDPRERTKRQVLQMIREASPTLGSTPNNSAGHPGAYGSSRRRTGMHDLRHKLNGEHHPMAETILRTKPDKGPRYT